VTTSAQVLVLVLVLVLVFESEVLVLVLVFGTQVLVLVLGEKSFLTSLRFVLLRLTADRYEASATAQLLVLLQNFILTDIIALTSSASWTDDDVNVLFLYHVDCAKRCVLAVAFYLTVLQTVMHRANVSASDINAFVTL